MAMVVELFGEDAAVREALPLSTSGIGARNSSVTKGEMAPPNA